MAQAPALPTGFELPLEARLPRIGAVDAVALEERAASLAKRSIKKDAKVWALLLAIRTTDLTTLEGADTPGKASAVASKARRPDPSDPSVPPVAAVCVYPNLVPAVRERLAGSGVKVAAVATGFPSGQYPTAIKVADVRATVELGADEIDMVIDRGAFLSGRYAKVYDEIVQVKEACGSAHLKVILETGELGTYDNVRRATLLAIAAGADFVKTSTGKIPSAATLPVSLCMLEAIRDVYGDWTYASAAESRDIVHIADRYGYYVGGKWLEPAETYETIAPRDEEPLAAVGQATAEDVGRAVAAARTAYADGWSSLPGSERAKYLFRIARILQERSREFAVLESLNGGKPIKESRDVDLPLAAAHFFYYAGWADKLDYAFPNRTARPLGVAGQVIPWNFPLLMAAWKLAPALATGNTAVLKPAETTPLTALLLAELIQEAGLPPGVVNILTGAGETGAAVVRHSGVDKIACTGSTEGGKRIQRATAGTGKRLTLELGGKAANIVFDDAPIDQAIEGIVNGIYFNQGHVCCAGSRLLVQESIVDILLDRLRQRMALLRLGDPLDKNTDVGAINSAAQLDRIRELSAAGEAEGAQRWSPPCDLPSRGFWFAPTLFTGVSQSHRIAREEIFGPVLSVLTFRTPEEAVAKANNTPYGLSAGVWTEKGSRILWMAQRLRAGVVWANTYNRFDPASPFGGYQESGFGREGGRAGPAAD